MDLKKFKEKEKVKEKVVEKKNLKDPLDDKYARKEYSLKTEKEANLDLKRNFKNLFDCTSIVPDWPSEEEIKSFEFTKYTDEEKKKYLIFKDSIKEKLTFPNERYININSNWKRPEDYVRDHFLDQELISKFPQRNHIIMRNEVKDYYYRDMRAQEERRIRKEYNLKHGIDEDDSIEEYLKDKLQKRIYAKFYKYLEDSYEIYICPIKPKDENDPDGPKEFCPGRITLKEKSTDFIKWISSIYQTINDLNIPDYSNSEENIFQKIYPQENNIPIYNPSGRYWVKLYNFGRAKLVEIDDNIPFDKYDEILTPKTDSIQELWPALLTKALLKMFHYKFQKENYLYEDIGDLQIIYALTGYQGEKIFLKNQNMTDYYSQYSYWISLKRAKASKEIKNKRKSTKLLPPEKNKIIEENTLKNYKIDEEDSHKDKETNKKLTLILRNILTKENYSEKRKYLLNFNTLNLYTKKDNKFDKIDELNESYFYPIMKKSSKISVRKESNTISIGSKELSKTNNSKNYRASKTKNDFNLKNDKKIKIVEKKSRKSNLKFLDSGTNLSKETLNQEKYNLLKSEDDEVPVLENDNKIINLDRLETFQDEKVVKPDNLLHLNFFKNIKNAAHKSQSQIENTVKRQSGKMNFFSTLRMLIVKATTEENEKYERKIFFGYIYPILDLFENQNFNMERLKPIDELAEVKKSNINLRDFKTMNKKEKKELIAEINRSKKKELDDRNNKINMLYSKGEECRYIKISNSNIFEEYLLDPDFYSEYQINIVRECLENNWNFPPLNYYEKISPVLNNQLSTVEKIKENSNFELIDNDEDERESKYSKRNSNLKKEITSSRIEQTSMSKNDYLLSNENSYFSRVPKSPITDIYRREKNNLRNAYGDLINNDFDIYSKKKPFYETKEKGYWIDIESYFDLFDNFIILHNPRFYKYYIHINNLWENSDTDKFSPKDLRTVFWINANEEDLEESNNIFDKKNFYSLLINFITIYSKGKKEEKNELEITEDIRKLDKIIETNVIFNLFEKDEDGEFVMFEENILLNNLYETKQINYIKKGKEYLLILKEGLFPIGYNLNIYSDCFIQGFSYNEYLEKHKNYNTNLFEINIDLIEGKKFFLLGKFMINAKDNLNLRISFKNLIGDNYLNEFLEIILEKESDTQGKKIILDNNFDLEMSEENYLITFILNPPYFIKDFKANVSFLVNGECSIEKIEKNDIFEISDTFSPNKNSFIVKDLLQCQEDLYCTLFFRINLLRKSDCHVVTNSNMNFYSPISDAENDKAFPFLLGKSCDKLGEEFELKEKVRMKIKIFRNDKVIFTHDFYNQLFISNLKLSKTEDYSDKKLNMDNMYNFEIDIYKLEIYFDKSEVPEWIKDYKLNDNEYLNWTLRVHSTQNMYLIVDKIREDTENLIKDSWECGEPGRKDRAKIARMKYNIIKKKRNGELLTIEEEEIFNKPKIKVKDNTDADSNKSVKSDYKEEPNKYDYLRTEIEREVDNVNVLLPDILNTDFTERTPIRNEKYTNKNMKEFFEATNREKVLYRNSNSVKKILLTENLKQEKQMNIESKIKVFENVYKKQQKRVDKIKHDIDFSLKSIQFKSYKKISSKNNRIAQLISTRETFATKFNVQKESELNLLDTLKKFENDHNEIKECTENYNKLKNTEFKSENLTRIHKIISHKKEKMVLHDIENYGISNKDLMVRHYEDYKLNKWDFNFTTIKKLKAFIS